MVLDTNDSGRTAPEIAALLVENGYMPVPIPPGQKGPRISDWQIRDFREFAFPEGCNIGIRCGNTQVSFLDIDIYCEDIVSVIIAKWRQRFGDRGTHMQRTGFAPKTGIPFRTDAGASKTSQAVRPTGKAPLDEKGKPKIEQVEVLATGQQFVAYGIHPDTQQPYLWHGLDPTDNLLGRAEDLPYVSTTEVAEFLAWVAEEFGPETKTLPLSERTKPDPAIKIAFGIDGGVIEAFNNDHNLQELLLRYGYRHRYGDHWTSPNSGTGSANVQVLGDRWRSLSGSDAALGLGKETKGGIRSGDAFDLYAFYEHGGDFNCAVKSYAQTAGLNKCAPPSPFNPVIPTKLEE